MTHELYDLRGKVVESCHEESLPDSQKVVIKFTDGWVLTLESWDYESFASGLITELTKPD